MVWGVLRRRCGDRQQSAVTAEDKYQQEYPVGKRRWEKYRHFSVI